MKKTERRRETISIAMSQDEEKAIRQAAHTAGVSLSEWARTAMFKYMGKPVPARDTRVRDWDRIEEETGEKTKARK